MSIKMMKTCFYFGSSACWHWVGVRSQYSECSRFMQMLCGERGVQSLCFESSLVSFGADVRTEVTVAFGELRDLA